MKLTTDDKEAILLAIAVLLHTSPNHGSHLSPDLEGFSITNKFLDHLQTLEEELLLDVDQCRKQGESLEDTSPQE